jgi:hypothetical protein
MILSYTFCCFSVNGALSTRSILATSLMFRLLFANLLALAVQLDYPALLVANLKNIRVDEQYDLP